MIKRTQSKKLKYLATKFPVVMLTGPRQSGKTTLAKYVFENMNYVSLEDPDNRLFAEEDHRGFLMTYENGVIVDEIQRVPNLYSYIQTKVDETGMPGQYVLTGSQNFLIHEKVSQSLAGRVAILKLLPLSLEELKTTDVKIDRINHLLFSGMYPRLYDVGIEPTDWYPNYIQTYLERDVRLIKNVHDLTHFQVFVKSCAARIGQLLNLSSIASDCGISHTTAKSWLTLLESSYMVYLLKPHMKNFNKRLTKMPKIYFYDTGLAASLLGIHSAEQFSVHFAKGALFESFIITELLKQRYNNGMSENIYFWRDKNGHEVDCIIDNGNRLYPVEIKYGRTVNQDYFKGINYWNKLSGGIAQQAYVIYGGDKVQKRSDANVLPWANLYDLDTSVLT